MTMVSLEQLPPIGNKVLIHPILPIVQELTEELTLTERIETLVPLTYMLCFAISYYGPNAELMGNVKLTLWHFKSVLDIENYMKNLFMLFSVDFMSLVINWIILKTTCNINIFKTFQKLQSEFWLIMAVQQAYSMIEVIKFIIHIQKIYDLNIHVYNFQMFSQLYIGSGQDLTFELEWINGIYANNFTITSGSQNISTYI